MNIALSKLKWIGLAGILILCIQCAQDKVAGNTSEVVNPGLTVSLKIPEPHPSQSFHIKAYISEHNPLVDSVPLFTIVVDGKTSFTLDSSNFSLGIKKFGTQAKQKEINSDPETIKFNLLIESPANHSALIQAVSFNPLENKFKRNDLPVDTITLELSSPQKYVGSLKKRIPSEVPRIIYIPGSPYFAHVDSLSFSFNSLPPDSYPLRILTDSLLIYTSNKPLVTTLVDTISYSTVIDTLKSLALPNLAPKITSPFLPLNLKLEDSTQLSLSVEGSLPIIYQWRRNQVPISEANNSSYVLQAGVNVLNGDKFDVIVQNWAGADTSIETHVNIAYPPFEIGEHPKNQRVYTGDTAHFNVHAFGPNLHYQWRRNGKTITGIPDSMALRIDNLQLANNGDIIDVIVSSSWGIDTSTSATLTVVKELVLRKPNGGETYQSTDNLTIEWQIDSASKINSVWPFISKSPGSTWEKLTTDPVTKSNIVAVHSSLTISVSNLTCTQCRIRLEAFQKPEAFDESDSTFTILP